MLHAPSIMCTPPAQLYGCTAVYIAAYVCTPVLRLDPKTAPRLDPHVRVTHSHAHIAAYVCTPVLRLDSHVRVISESCLEQRLGGEATHGRQDGRRWAKPAAGIWLAVHRQEVPPSKAPRAAETPSPESSRAPQKSETAPASGRRPGSRTPPRRRGSRPRPGRQQPVTHIGAAPRHRAVQRSAAVRRLMQLAAAEKAGEVLHDRQVALKRSEMQACDSTRHGFIQERLAACLDQRPHDL